METSKRYIYGVTNPALRTVWQRIDDWLIGVSRVPLKDIARIYHELSLLTSSGLGLPKALELIADRNKNKRLQRVLWTVGSLCSLYHHGLVNPSFSVYVCPQTFHWPFSLDVELRSS